MLRKATEQFADAEAAPGLADWLRDVVFANAEARGVEPQTAAWG
ncbi:hypothetical protein [Actinocorallia populi]|nr:hypothetical protein [Actinocorallia populi]